MKTYLLKNPAAVEPQKGPGTGLAQSADPAAPPDPLRRDPVVTALTEAIAGPPPAPKPGQILYIGLDVHNDSIAVSLAPGDSTAGRRYGLIGGSHDDVLRLLKKRAAAPPGVTLKFCYQAGPRGYPLGRFIRAHGHSCIIVAPSKVPRKPGEPFSHQIAKMFLPSLSVSLLEPAAFRSGMDIKTYVSAACD